MTPLHRRAAAALAALSAAPLTAAAQSFINSTAAYTWTIVMRDPAKSNFGAESSSTGIAGERARIVSTCGAVPKDGGCTVIDYLQPLPPATPQKPAWIWTGGPNPQLPGTRFPWYPNTLAAEAESGFGINRVRAFGSGVDCGALDLCNSTGQVLDKYESASAQSIYVESFAYAGPSGTYEAVIHLDGRWSGGGALAFEAGLRDGDGRIEGASVVNCLAGSAGCPQATVHLQGDDPLNRNGSFSLQLVVPLQLQQDEPFTFAASLNATAEGGHLDSQIVDAFNTARVEFFRLAPGATLSAASGTAYAVTAVPEPMSLAMWLAGVAVLALRRAGHLTKT